MDTATAAKILGVEPITIHKHVKRGNLKATKRGAILDVDPQSVKTYYERRVSELLTQIEAMQDARGLLDASLKQKGNK